MSYNVSGGNLLPAWTKITSAGAKDILDLGTRAGVLSIMVTELSGGTPNLTLEVYDGTNSYFLRYQKPMAAKETFVFNEPFGLDPNQKLRVTVSAGNADVCVIYINPNQS
ncbi:hypothetical protein [Devosia sp. DBB001]|nr:hypothetical protein [Devosia sp. DBB001]